MGLKIVAPTSFHSGSKGSSTSPIPDADKYFTWSVPFPLCDRFWMLQRYGLYIYLRASRGGTGWLRADTWAWLWPSQGGFKRVETKQQQKKAKLGGIWFVAKLLHWKKAQAVVRWCFLQSNEAVLGYQTVIVNHKECRKALKDLLLLPWNLCLFSHGYLMVSGWSVWLITAHKPV